jgi:hypothetical protein
MPVSKRQMCRHDAALYIRRSSSFFLVQSNYQQTTAMHLVTGDAKRSCFGSWKA